MKLKQLKSLCKILEDYEREHKNSEVEFLLNKKVYIPNIIDYETDSQGDIWKLIINLKIEE